MPKNKKRNRKTKQNRQPSAETRLNDDLAHIFEPFSDTKIFNPYAQGMPRFGAVNKKDNKVYNFLQSNIAPLWLVSTMGAVGQASIFFNLTNTNESTNFQAIFDQWRIAQIEVWLVPTGGNFSSAGTNTSGKMYTVIDYDDANTLGTVAAAMNYQNVTQTTSNQGVYRRFKPHNAVAAYSGAFTSFQNVVNQWCDSGSPNIQHYGFKAIWSTLQATSWDLEYRLWYQFRNIF